MVTKHDDNLICLCKGSVLAKIHMVTKLPCTTGYEIARSVLAKIHMVTKRL